MQVLGQLRLWGVLALLIWPTAPAVARAQPANSTANRPLDEAVVRSGDHLTLPDALAQALAENPRLSVFDLAIRVRDAEALQASLRPRPTLDLQLDNFAGSGELSGFGAAEVTLSVAQRFELGDKRSQRQAAARVGSELAGWDYESVRRDVFNEVTRAFIAVVAAQRQLTLANDLIDVARQDRAAVNRRVEAGAASPIELTRARIAVATAEMDQQASALALGAARAQLAETLGSGSPAFGDVIGDLDQIAQPPAFAELQRRLEANPDVARWETELRQRQATLALQRALGKIDLVAAAGIRRLAESDAHALVAGVSVPLPFGNRNQGNVQAAEYRLAQVDQERRAALDSATAALAASHAEAAAAYGTATALKQGILPQAREAMETAESAYLKGLFSFTDVLAVRLTYFELRGRFLGALARYHTATADIERLVAGPLLQDEQKKERQ